MGPAKKTPAAPPAETAPKKRLKAEDKKKEKDAVEVSDTADENVSKLDNQKLLNFLKYRADPAKNKRGEQLHEAQQVLEARCFPTISFPKFFPIIHFINRLEQKQALQKNTGTNIPEKNHLKITLFTLGLCAGLQRVATQPEAHFLAAVESQWFDQFEVVWSILRNTLWRQCYKARSPRRLVQRVLCCFL